VKCEKQKRARQKPCQGETGEIQTSNVVLKRDASRKKIKAHFLKISIEEGGKVA